MLRFEPEVAHFGWRSSGQASCDRSASASRVLVLALVTLLWALLLWRGLTRIRSSLTRLPKPRLCWDSSLSLVMLNEVLGGGDDGRLQWRHTSGSELVPFGLLLLLLLFPEPLAL